MADENPSDVQSGKPQSTSFHVVTMAVSAWRELLTPRERLLVQIYNRWICSLSSDSPQPTTLAEARDRLRLLQQAQPLSDVETDANESKIVLTTKILSTWIVLWLTIIPTVIVTVVGLQHFRHVLEMKGMLWLNLAFTFFVLAILFYVSAVLGLLLQGILAMPFIGVVNRWLAGPTGHR